MELNNNDQRTLHAPSLANPDYGQDTYKWLGLGVIIAQVYQQLGAASGGEEVGHQLSVFIALIF